MRDDDKNNGKLYNCVGDGVQPRPNRATRCVSAPAAPRMSGGDVPEQGTEAAHIPNDNNNRNENRCGGREVDVFNRRPEGDRNSISNESCKLKEEKISQKKKQKKNGERNTLREGQ